MRNGGRFPCGWRNKTFSAAGLAGTAWNRHVSEDGPDDEVGPAFPQLRHCLLRSDEAD